MSVYKGQYICEGKGRGWTETWYWEASASTLDTQGTRFEGTVATRRLLFGKEYGIKGYRVSEELNGAFEPVLNDSWLRHVEYLGFQSEPGWEQDLALVVKAQNSTRTQRRNTYMRGCWDKIEEDGGNLNKAYGTWGTKFSAWAATMFELGVGWVHRTPSPSVVINSAIQNLDNRVTITTAAPLFTLPPGGYKPTRVNIRSAGIKSVLSGIQIVLPSSTTVAQTVKPLAIFPQATVGWLANTFALSFTPAAFLEQAFVTRRPAGSPLLESVGRQKAKARG